MDLDKIRAKREAEARRKEEQAKSEAAKANADSVSSTVRQGAQAGVAASSSVQSAVQSSGDKVVSEVAQVKATLEAGQDSVAQAINNLMLATVLTKDPRLAEAADNVAKLLTAIADAGSKFQKSNLNLLPVANKELAQTISILAQSVREKQDTDLSPQFDKVVAALNGLEVKPVVKVAPADVTVPVDLSGVTEAIESLKAEEGSASFPTLEGFVAQDLDNKNPGFQYVGLLRADGAYCLIENDIEANSMRYVFGKQGYTAAWGSRIGRAYRLFDEAIDALAA